MDPVRSLRNLPRREFLALAGALGLGGMLPACSSTGEETSSSTLVTNVGVAEVPNPVGSIVTRWRADPFSVGSYSFLAVGSTPEDRETLAASQDGVLYFAGEATSRNFPSTVHGALRSGQDAADEMLARNPTSALVIGAGASGLAAAQDLAAAGVQVTVLEARQRTGGRVFTDSSLGIPLDLGASWIHGVDGNPLTELADAIGADRAATDYNNYRARNAEGVVVSASELPEDFRDVTVIEHEYAADVGDLSDEATDEGIEFSGGDVIFPDGYQPVIESMIDGYGVETGMIVESIAYGSAGVTVSTGGTTYEADLVLVTVPLGVLKAGSIVFDPPLGEAKREAIDRLGMGLLNKVYLQFEERFWEPDVDVFGYVGEKRGFFAEWLNIAKFTGEPILVGFNAASAADDLEALTDEEVVAEAMVAIRNMYEVSS